MNYKKIKLLSRGEIEQLVSLKEAIADVRDAFRKFRSREDSCFSRSVIDVSGKKGHLLSMPFYLTREGTLGAKIITVFPDCLFKEVPTISGMLVLCDSDAGGIISIMDAESITSLRTGAVSAIAHDILSRKDSKTMALFGAGVQGKVQIKATLEVRKIERIKIYDVDSQKSKKLASELRKKYKGRADFCSVSNPEEALVETDIIVTATTSSVPVFDGNLVQEGAHVTAIGSFKPHSRELDDALLSRARIFVDSYSQCLKEAGDIIIALKNNSIKKSNIHGELRELITGEKKGRKNKEDITVFKSVGLAIQDAALARRTYERAEELGIGKNISLNK